MSDNLDHDGGAPQERGFLATTKGIVTGITSLVVAVTGLVVACEKLIPDEGAPPQAAVSNASTDSSGQAAAESTNDTAQTAVADPVAYMGEAFTLQLDEASREWILTGTDKVANNYEEVRSDRDGEVMAHLATTDSYIRWPVEGGRLELSNDSKETWSRLDTIEAVDESKLADWPPAQ